MARATTAKTKRGGQSLADQAYAEIRRRIITCAMGPGYRFTEAQIASELRIGETPVREALTRLIQNRLVRNIPRHGYEVSPITLQDVVDLFDFRLVIEPAAAERVAGRVDAELLRKLNELCQVGYRIDDPDSADDFLRANREFHVTIARATGNRRVVESVEGLLDESERLFRLGILLRDRSQEMEHEHEALVNALEAGDGEAARRSASEQILAARRMVLDALMTSPSLLTTPLTAAELFPNPALTSRATGR